MDGLRGAPAVLKEVWEAGFRYVSSKAWGPDWTLPALLHNPFTYAEDGFPDLWELPCSGWHDNVLKFGMGNQPVRLIAFPAPYPEAVPLKPIETPEEEIAINRAFIDRALAGSYTHLSLVWHPRSITRFDPDMKMLVETFRYAQSVGMQFATYEQLWKMMIKQQTPSTEQQGNYSS
ncbi:MAG: hypothetical protein NZ959_11030 [Armatimonadetes bacterium]|nr:hypothetical protein [Armatimonadota bacterium]MDW8120691.1 hypothetical protein [Armatimonadota bacterium]